MSEMMDSNFSFMRFENKQLPGQVLIGLPTGKKAVHLSILQTSANLLQETSCDPN